MLYEQKNPHGGDGYGMQIAADFSVNTNPLGPPEAVCRAVPGVHWTACVLPGPVLPGADRCHCPMGRSRAGESPVRKRGGGADPFVLPGSAPPPGDGAGADVLRVHSIAGGSGVHGGAISAFSGPGVCAGGGCALLSRTAGSGCAVFVPSQ